MANPFQLILDNNVLCTLGDLGMQPYTNSCVCAALSTLRHQNHITDEELRRARRYIRRVLKGYTFVHDWLYDACPEYRTYIKECSTKERHFAYRDYRKAWCAHMAELWNQGRI